MTINRGGARAEVLTGTLDIDGLAVAIDVAVGAAQSGGVPAAEIAALLQAYAITFAVEAGEILDAAEEAGE